MPSGQETFPSRELQATEHLNARPLSFLQLRLSPHTSSSLQDMLEGELAQGLPPLGRALGNKVGTTALWAHSQGELPPPEKHSDWLRGGWDKSTTHLKGSASTYERSSNVA